MQIKFSGTRISIELHILLEAIQHAFNAETKQDVHVEVLKKHNPERLRKLVNYHRIKPLLLNFDRSYPFLDAGFRMDLEHAHVQQVKKNLRNIKITQDILKMLSVHEIPCLPMKGSLFINTIYRNQQIREVNDIDILCQKKDVRQVIRLLQNEGYQLRLGAKYFQAEHEAGLLDILLKDDYFNEISLSKPGVHIDLHWELCKPYNGIQFKAHLLFENTELGDFYGQQIVVPSTENLYWMLMIHHGAVERWSKLKFIADLWAFHQAYGSIIDMDRILEQSHHYKINRAIQFGYFLSDTVLINRDDVADSGAYTHKLKKNDSLNNPDSHYPDNNSLGEPKFSELAATSPVASDFLKQVLERWELAEVLTSEVAWSKLRLRLKSLDPEVSKFKALVFYIRHYWNHERLKRFPESIGLLSFINRIKNRLKS